MQIEDLYNSIEQSMFTTIGYTSVDEHKKYMILSNLNYIKYIDINKSYRISFKKALRNKKNKFCTE